MNPVVSRSANSQIVIPADVPGIPKLSPVVANALACLLDPVVGRGQYGQHDPGHRVAPVQVNPFEWEEAQRTADVIDGFLRPVPLELMGAWLLPVNLSCRNRQSPEDFRMLVMAIHEMCSDLPAAAFTAETRRAIRADGFFPSADHVRQAIEPIATGWLRARDGLRNLHRDKPPEPEKRVKESLEVKQSYAEQNRLVVEALRTQMEERERAARPSGASKANHISPAHRIAFHRGKGQHAVADAIAKANGIDERDELDDEVA